MFRGRPHDVAALPEIVRQYEAFKAGASTLVPDAPFQMLTSLPLAAADWKQVARNAPWQMTRMNLNTFARHGVFDGRDKEIESIVTDRLRDPERIARARVFPYQLMVAHATADSAVPPSVREVLQDAMEVAIANVPKVDGGVWVFPDVLNIGGFSDRVFDVIAEFARGTLAAGHRVGAIEAVTL